MKNIENKLTVIIKERLVEIFPKIISVQVDIVKSLSNSFNCQINVHTDKNTYHANKIHQNYKVSLQKASDAIKKQMQRKEENQKNARTKHLDVLYDTFLMEEE